MYLDDAKITLLMKINNTSRPKGLDITYLISYNNNL